MENLFNKEIAGRLFNFQPMNMGNTSGYHVDVKDEDGTRYEFRVEHEADDSVKMTGENLPGWIKALESDIKAVIAEHS